VQYQKPKEVNQMKHKQISIISTIFILAMIVLLAGSTPAAARAERIYFSGEDCPIYVGAPEKQWVSEDGALHMRGIPMITTLTYNPPVLNGTNHIVMNQDVDPTGAIHVYGSVEIHPYDGEGIWVGRFSTHVSPEGVVEGKAVAHGTGDFEGMITFNNVSSPDAFDPACFNMNTASNGYILIP
jgi:hypothetical protein